MGVGSAVSLDKLVTVEAVAAYTDIIFDFGSICRSRFVGESMGLSDQVRIPYASNNSASANFTYAGGITLGGFNVDTGNTVTLNNYLYQTIAITDSDWLKLGPSGFAPLVAEAAGRLGSDVMSASFASVVTATNFPSSGSYTSTNYSGSTIAFADLRKKFVDNKIPLDGVSIVAGSTLFQNILLNNSVFNWQSVGAQQAVTSGRPTQLLGFNILPTSVTLPNSDTGFAIAKNAFGFVAATPAPPSANLPGVLDYKQVVDPKGTGITFGAYLYYDFSHKTTMLVFESLSGTTKLDANSLLHIK